MPKVSKLGRASLMIRAAKASLFMALSLAMSADPGFPQSPQWRTLPNAPVSTGRMDDVFFINPSLGWVLSNNYNSDSTAFLGDIWKTMDGGATWALQITLNQYLRSVGFADSLTGWVGTVFDPDSLLYHTTDGGTTWALVQNIPEPRPLGICGISVVNDSVMYASGRYSGPARVIKTTDRGANWTSFDLYPLADNLVDCRFFSPDSGFVVGSIGADYHTGYGRVLFTSDGGSTWATRYAGTRSEELCWKIQFLNRTTGYVSIENFSLGPTYYLKTTDGGGTWSDELFLNTPYEVQGIGFATDSLGWMGGWGGDTFETTDAGASWHLAGFGYIVNRFRFLSDKLAYAVGETVYKYELIRVPGDLNGDGNFTAADIVLLINCVFQQTGECDLSFTDLNCNGGLSAADIVTLINVVFQEIPVTCTP
ncbi:MAG: dockerin type I domain-containing protein [candidate division Zixibacteria bacterium]|nr:dockerin type I domain-containing protein [candidate division Zixibacteria bacterium]